MYIYICIYIHKAPLNGQLETLIYIPNHHTSRTPLNEEAKRALTSTSNQSSTTVKWPTTHSKGPKPLCIYTSTTTGSNSAPHFTNEPLTNIQVISCGIRAGSEQAARNAHVHTNPFYLTYEPRKHVLVYHAELEPVVSGQPEPLTCIQIPFTLHTNPANTYRHTMRSEWAARNTHIQNKTLIYKTKHSYPYYTLIPHEHVLTRHTMRSLSQ